MTKITKKTSIEELGAIVCEKLKEHSIDIVLTGGAVVSIYSKNEYESYDLDFIVEGLGKKVDKAMNELGFTKEKGRPFSHSHTPYTVEFPAGPLMVGNVPVKNVATRKTKNGSFVLLPPTECVMDRLSAYFHFNDPQGLEQAVLVAKAQPIKLKRIKTWAKAEGAEDKLQNFIVRLKSN
ncbi:MAG: hypothetical protein JST80_04520 [Bdellovibrionales bacterium]|nr:hypothetical protein [Bdellovibrionales bacterium]